LKETEGIKGTREIRVENLNLNYGTFPALKNISFQLSGGKIYGLLGRNGAGKTSLLSILAGFRLPSSGKVEIDGENPFEHPDLMSQIVFVRDKNMDEESEKVKKLLSFLSLLVWQFPSEPFFLIIILSGISR